MKCVELYLSGEMYVSKIVSKYNIPDASNLKRWKLLNIVLNITVIIRELKAPMMFRIAMSILGRKNMMLMEKKGYQINVAPQNR